MFVYNAACILCICILLIIFLAFWDSVTVWDKKVHIQQTCGKNPKQLKHGKIFPNSIGLHEWQSDSNHLSIWNDYMFFLQYCPHFFPKCHYVDDYIGKKMLWLQKNRSDRFVKVFFSFSIFLSHFSHNSWPPWSEDFFSIIARNRTEKKWCEPKQLIVELFLLIRIWFLFKSQQMLAIG